MLTKGVYRDLYNSSNLLIMDHKCLRQNVLCICGLTGAGRQWSVIISVNCNISSTSYGNHKLASWPPLINLVPRPHPAHARRRGLVSQVQTLGAAEAPKPCNC